MSASRKAAIHALLKGIETGDPAAVAVVNPDKYIQHNPQTQEGGEGLAVLFKRLSLTNPRVNLVRVFADDDYVFAHTEYFFSRDRIGFEVFRFEDELTVEHWDNIQSRLDLNASGHSMVDGSAEIDATSSTEMTRAHVRSFLDEALIARRFDSLGHFVSDETFVEHSPNSVDGLAALRSMLASDTRVVRYERVHRVLAEHNFALSVCEGSIDDVHTSFYDLFRVSDGRIVEHWDTTETVPPQSEWKNTNGKF